MNMPNIISSFLTEKSKKNLKNTKIYKMRYKYAKLEELFSTKYAIGKYIHFTFGIKSCKIR